MMSEGMSLIHYSGKHTFKFDGQNLASSVYYYQIKAGEFQQVRKMILMK